MSLLRIPEKLHSEFRTMLKLPQEKKIEIVDYLANIEVGTSVSTILEGIPDEIKGEGNSVGVATSILYSIFSALDVSELEPDKFRVSFLKALQEADLLEEGKEDEFDEILIRLLSFKDRAELSSKLESVLSSNQRMVTNEKIVTDIRPILRGDDPADLAGFSILHNLGISFLEDGRRKTRYYTFDSEELENLQKEVELAIEKQKAFKSKFEDAGVNYLEVK